MDSTNDIVIEVFEGGDLDAPELNAEIGRVWAALLADDFTRAEIAREFEVEEGALATLGVPFVTRVKSSGSLVSSVALIVGGMILNSFAEAAIDYGRDKTLEAARRVWKKYVARKVSPPGSNKLGRPKDERS